MIIRIIHFIPISIINEIIEIEIDKRVGIHTKNKEGKSKIKKNEDGKRERERERERRKKPDETDKT